LVIQAGLFPPTATSAGTFTAAHSAPMNGVPRWWSCMIVMSYGSVWATALSFGQTGVNGMTAVTKAGVPTNRMNILTASPLRPSATSWLSPSR